MYKLIAGSDVSDLEYKHQFSGGLSTLLQNVSVIN